MTFTINSLNAENVLWETLTQVYERIDCFKNKQNNKTKPSTII